MKVSQLKKLVKKEKAKLVDPDGFDLAFYEGIEHILEHCGDGGLTEQYIHGIEFALEQLSDCDIGE